MTSITSRQPTVREPVSRGWSAVRRILPQLITFGAVGGVAFVVDVGGYIVLRATVMPDQVIWAKVVSVTVATAVAWVGHRSLTFREPGVRRRPTVREVVLFLFANGGGLAIAAGCLYLSHYVIGFTSALADNISGNVIGLALGTAFRYFAYRHVVFRTAQEASA